MTAGGRDARRQEAERRGHRAETLAALALVLKGYRILARRYRTPIGEIDLIARKGDLIALVEVKGRAEARRAVDAVSLSAQQRIRAAGELWLSRQRDAHRLSIRCDILAVVPWRWPTHYPDAF